MSLTVDGSHSSDPLNSPKPKFKVGKKAQDVKVGTVSSGPLEQSSNENNPHTPSPDLSSQGRSVDLLAGTITQTPEDPSLNLLKQIGGDVKEILKQVNQNSATDKNEILKEALEDAQKILEELNCVEGRMKDPYMKKALIEWQPIHAKRLNKQKDELNNVEKTLLKNGIKEFPEDVIKAREELTRLMGRHQTFETQKNDQIEDSKNQILKKASENAKKILEELNCVEGRMNDRYMTKALIAWQPVHEGRLNKQKDELNNVERTLLENGIKNFPEEVLKARKEFERIMNRHKDFETQKNDRLKKYERKITGFRNIQKTGAAASVLGIAGLAASVLAPPLAVPSYALLIGGATSSTVGMTGEFINSKP